LDEAFDILAPYERNMVAEFLLIKLDQAVAMAILLLAHLIERGSRRGEIGFQSVGEVAEDAGIFFFQGNCQGKQFAFAKAAK
jgi:hypothetical protein